MTTASTSPITAGRCPRCETTAAAGQRFCRQCGYRFPVGADAVDDADPSSEIDRSSSTLRPVSRVLIAVIVVLFAVLGALAALLIDGIRDEPDQPPTTDADAAVVSELAASPGGTRPITNTD